MSKSDTIFNKQDWRCATVQLMLSTDPSYDNRTRCTTDRAIARLPRITGMCPGWWKQSFWLWSWSLVWFQERVTSCHLTSSKSAWKSTPKCTWICWREWWSPGAIRWPWQTLGMAAGLGAYPQVQRHPGLASEGVLQLCTLFLLPPSPTWTRWTASFGHTSKTSPTWPPMTAKPAWSPPSTEYSPISHRCLWKGHAPSSESISRRWLRLNRCQLYYIIKIPELIFSIKALK